MWPWATATNPTAVSVPHSPAPSAGRLGKDATQDVSSSAGRRARSVPCSWARTDDGVCLLEFTDRRALETQLDTVRRRFASAIVPGEHEHLCLLQSELDRYFAGTLKKFTVQLVYPGTAFQRQVWEHLLQIPYGETRSYEEIARAAGAPGAAGCRHRQWAQSHQHRHSVPPRCQQGWPAGRLRRRTVAQAISPGPGTASTKAAMSADSAHPGS